MFLISNRDRVMQYYTFFLASLFIWSGSAVMMRFQIWPGFILDSDLTLRNTVIFSFRVLSNGLLYCFHQANYQYVLECLAFMLIANGMGLVISQAYIIRLPSTDSHSHYAFTYVLGPMAGWVVLIFALAVCIFYKAFYYRMQQGVQSAPIRWLIVAFGIIYVGAFTNIFTELGQYPFDIFCCTVSANLICFAIFRNRMAELSFIVARGAAFSALLLLAGALYTGLLWLLNRGAGRLSGALLSVCIPFCSYCSSIVSTGFYSYPLTGGKAVL